LEEDPSFFGGLAPQKKGEEKELVISLASKKRGPPWRLIGIDINCLGRPPR
jgi:hypothetical protein